MRFRILGPLEVETDDDAPAALGGPKPRALLAMLLVQRGTVVSVDRLAEALWGGDPPRGAVPALRAYVSRLRTALGGDRLRHRPPGYVLGAADAEVDAARFEQLAGQARARADDPAGALELLDEALALWRGDALAEFADLEPIRGEAARLAELRLVAVEDRFDALLRLGRDADVAAGTESFVRRFPTRERPAVQLMRALYRCGRQSDALAAYHALRRRLDDELGVEPADPAQAEYRRILARDPSLTPSRPRTNLPRRATSFVGREREVAELTRLLQTAPLVTLTGVGGVGKSRLAEEVAGRDTDRWPDGVWLCELAPLADGGPVGHAVAGTLRVQQRHGLSIAETVIEYLHRRRLLLVLDNCEHVLDAAASLLDAVVRQCPEVAVLATSREPLGVDGERRWPVPPLPARDAAALFVERAAAQRPDFDPAGEGPGSIEEICRRLDGLPLAIELAAARTRAMSTGEIARRLDSGRLLSGGPRGASPRHQSLAAAIEWSHRQLPPAEQRLFARLSVFAGGFDLAAAHRVGTDPATSEDAALDALTSLVDRSLVVARPGPAGTRYRLLETLRAFGRDRLPEPAEELARRHAAYYADLAECAARGLLGPDEGAWRARVVPDHDNMRAAFLHAAATGDADLALRLVTSLIELAHLRVSYESADWAQRALDFAPEDHPLFPAAAGAAARGAWNHGDFGRARQLAARAGGRSPGPGTGRPSHPGDVLADVALYEGDVEAALRHYTAEVDRARRDADTVRLVWTLYYVAVCHAVRRDPAAGRPAAAECVAVAEEIRNPTARSMARYALGLVLKKAEPDRALALFDEAAALAAEVGNFWWQGIGLMEAAATRGVHGDPVAAARAFVEVLDHWERVGDWTQQWLNLRYIVRLLLRLGADEDAAVLHHCLLAAGKPSPLGPDGAAALRDRIGADAFAAAAERAAGLGPAGAVLLARSALVPV